MKKIFEKISEKSFRLEAVILATIIFILMMMPGTARAAEPKVNVKAKVLFVGGSSVRPEYGESYILKLKNKPKKYSVSWKSDDEGIATVKWMKSGKAELKAVGVGKTVVTASLHDKVTGKDYSLKVNVTIKKNCADVSLTPAVIEEMNVGDSVDLKGMMVDAEGREVVRGEDVTDFIKWYSENPEIVSVDSYGRITAMSKGTTNVVLYAAQTNVGDYSMPEKAVAMKKLECKVTGTQLISAKQSGLNKIKLEFSDSVKDSLKTEDITVTNKFDNAKITDMSFSEDGKEVNVTFLTTLNVGIKYNVAWGDYVMSFTASKGIPEKLELYTETDSDSLIVDKPAEIKVRFIDGNGIDITPLSEKSDEYVNMMNKVVFRVTAADNTASTSAWMTGNRIMFTEPDKSVVVNAEYVTLNKEGDKLTEVKATGSVKLSCISVAHSIQLEKLTFTNTTEALSKLDWDKALNIIAIGDVGYRAVARLWSSEGKYIYSDELGGKLTFTLANNSSCLGLFNDGSAYPFAKGTAVVLVSYDGIQVGAVEVGVVEQRTASNIVFTEKGEYISSKLSSSNYGVSSSEVMLKVLDQYGEPIKINSIGNSGVTTELKFTLPATGAPLAQCMVDNDGNAKVVFDAYGFGTSAGRDFKYSVNYDGPAGKASTDFVLTAVVPDSSLTSAYKVNVSGSGDVSMKADATEFPAISIDLTEYKGEIPNAKISTVYPFSDNMVPAVDVYYYKVFDKDGKLCSAGNETGKISLVYANGSKLYKYNTGEYTVNIYKGSLGGYLFVAGETFTVTDSKADIKVEQLMEKSGQKIYPEMSSAEIAALFGTCFKLTRGNESISASNITIGEPVIGNGQIIFRTVTVKDYVTIDGTAYYFENVVNVSRAVAN